MAMPRSSYRLFTALALLFASVAVAWADGGALAGRVETSTSPLATVRVYAYALADLSLRKEITDRSGVFLFDDLPAGLYKIIAFKRGFMPAVVMLSRASQDALQFLQVRLDTPPAYSEKAAASFWEIRESIPTDVLRDIDLPVVPVFAVDPGSPGSQDSPAYEETVPRSGFQTHVRATTGTHQGPATGESRLSGAQFDVTGQVNDLRIDLEGGYTALASGPFGDRGTNGSTQTLSLRVANSERRSTIGFSSSSSHLAGPGSLNDAESIDFERHQLTWKQSFGQRGSSSFSAQYVEESNFYRQAAYLAPAAIPGASRSFRIEGTYENQLTDRSNFKAGVRYRDRETDYRTANVQNPLPQKTVELFGRAGWKVKPAVVVQYGLYSALRDGTLSLAPQGGVVVQLGDNWQASTFASRRMNSEKEGYRRRIDFSPTYYRDARSCGEAQEYCYEFSLSRTSSHDGKIKFGASHRKIGETQRLFFDSDFFNHFDSLYLVDGDRLPEFKVEVTHRISPNVLTRIESHIGAGGGGLMRTADNSFYENEIRYLVTSVDTQFEGTDTGLYFAFHRLEQELTPLTGTQVASGSGSDIALERLQIGIRQDLGFLSRMASDLAVHLDMELSRGGASQELFDELRKRITGGLAITF